MPAEGKGADKMKNENKIKKDLESFYDFVTYEEFNQEVINPTLLIDHNIKNYILEKLTQKVTNYPEYFNFNFTDEKSFNTFNKNLAGEIYRSFLTLAKAVRKYNPLAKNKIEHKLEKAIISFLDLKGVHTVSLNQPVNQDGKYTELMDLIPAKSWKTYNESAGMFDDEDIDAEEEIINIKPKYNKRQPAQAETENLQMAFGF